MCGIAGFTSFHKKNYDKKNVMDSMLTAIEHRGPDASGDYFEDSINLGHRRLSIVDLESGAQPLTSVDGKLTIVFNGEIYNYVELQEQLKKQGFEFQTSSDTEVIIHLYRKYGLDFLSHLNGMFAIALWDKELEQLIIARDRMGEKPIYYQYRDDEFIFSSELKSLVKHPFVTKEISLRGLNKYLTYEYIPAPQTILENVWKVEAGEMIIIKKNSMKKSLYWKHPFHEFNDSGDVHGNEEQVLEQFDSLLNDSIRTRLQADVPVGVLLSGGIDSSLVTAVAAKQAKSKVKSFSIYFDEESYDESSYIKRMVDDFGLDHHHQTLRAQDMLGIIDNMGMIMDEPMSDPSIVPTYLLSKMTSQHVKTVLGGDGADELFAGYPTYVANKLIQGYNIIPYELRTPLTNFIKHSLGKFIPVSSKNIALDFKLQQFFRGAGVVSEIRFFKWMGGFLETEKKSILKDDVNQRLLGDFAYDDINRYLSRTNVQNELERLLYLSQKLYLCDDILHKVDRASMQNSLEVRAPFLDHRIVEFASQLPERYKLKGFNKKRILKKLAKRYIPNEIITRPKKGFGIPITQWLKEDLKAPMLDLLSKEHLDKQGIFEHDSINNLIQDHLNNKTNNRKLLWNLMCFQLWYKDFFN
jgi:asparagine synthase (glutamine-hydrolysing)